MVAARSEGVTGLGFRVLAERIAAADDLATLHSPPASKTLNTLGQ
ncbi:MAG: hypothetical protein Ct9H300mP1_37870 [Planctomycetaceae bacterium]|nr:MAG: hypothetical protein Ct9H300mP1_37870 [Planctomycetaceae bacterium]